MSVNVKLDTSGLDKFMAQYPAEVEKATRYTAFWIIRFGSPLSPLQTGALRNSAFVVTNQDNNFSQSVKAMQAARPAAMAAKEPKLTTEQLKRGFALVGYSANYALYLELGTRYIRARPWLVPTSQAAIPVLKDKLKEYIKKAAP